MPSALLSRRSFFLKVASVAVVAHVAPSLPVWGSTGGAHIGSIAGGFRALSPVSSDLMEASALSVEQVSKWFGVPAELIGEPSPVFTHARAESEAFADVLRRSV
jgi:hypothetical protein